MSTDAKASLADEMLSYLKADLVDYEPSSQVAAFYANRSVFITGATGFIGKVLVEKLVRTCKDIKQIYLLIREKRGKDVKDRLSELTKSRVFDRIKSQPNGSKLLEEKLCAIRGDITLPKFGISQEDIEILSKEISIVFNGAATVRFVEPIDVSVRNNIYCVSQLVEVCNDLENLQALIHLSTVYSNCHKKDTIHEIFYEPPMKGDRIISVVKELKQIQEDIHVCPKITAGTSNEDNTFLDEREDEEGGNWQPSRDAYVPQENLNELKGAESDMLIDRFADIALSRSNRPNVYTFTKAIAENYLLDLAKARPDRYLNDKIPVVIVRPSIVGCSWREPCPGFVDNFNASAGGIACLYTGAMQAFPGDGNKVADVVPVDMVSNFLLSVGWFILSGKQGKVNINCKQTVRSDKGAYLFNFVSGNRNPLAWHEMTDAIAILGYIYPTKMLMRLPSSHFVRPGILYELYDLLNQNLYARAQDFVVGTILSRELTDRNSSVAIYKRMRTLLATLTPFTTHQWRVSDANVRALYNCLPEVDKNLFEFDVEKINWTSYIRNYIFGTRIYALKDDAHTLPEALRTIRKRQLFSWTSYALLFLFFYYFFCRQSQLETALFGQLEL